MNKFRYLRCDIFYFNNILEVSFSFFHAQINHPDHICIGISTFSFHDHNNYTFAVHKFREFIDSLNFIKFVVISV